MAKSVCPEIPPQETESPTLPPLITINTPRLPESAPRTSSATRVLGALPAELIKNVKSSMQSLMVRAAHELNEACLDQVLITEVSDVVDGVAVPSKLSVIVLVLEIVHSKQMKIWQSLLPLFKTIMCSHHDLCTFHSPFLFSPWCMRT
jgi:hypothetical protein